MQDIDSLLAELEARTAEGWYGLDGVGDGWMPLLQEFVDKAPKLDPNWALLQAKEKFGALRIYFESTEEAWEELTSLADDLSNRSTQICMNCGCPATQQTRNMWVYTLCERCLPRKND